MGNSVLASLSLGDLCDICLENPSVVWLGEVRQVI